MLLVDADDQETSTDFTILRTEKRGEAGYTSIKLTGAAVRFEAAVQFGELLLELGKKEDAKVALEKAHALRPLDPQARDKLCHFEFERGHEYFDREDYEQAFRIWGAAELRFSPAFRTNQELAISLRECMRRFEKAGVLETERKGFEKALREGSATQPQAHRFFMRYLFSIGLIPEMYTPFEALEQEEERWKKSLEGHAGRRFFGGIALQNN